MELITMTKDQLNELVESATRNATVNAISHFQSVLVPKESKISTTKAYRIKETANFLDCSVSTIHRRYLDKKCLLKKNKLGLFTGQSIQLEYQRINGK